MTCYDVYRDYMWLTWDQAQFERFSYILSNGYRWNFRFALPAGM